jgi:glycosyltransferase involved in cell wall biosynthesis
MSAVPRVSVVIGAYDSARTLERAIAGILAQTVEDLELLVVDDGSRDESPAIAAAAAARDARVRPLVLGRNLGIAASLNVALAQARAPVVAVNDADDVSAPERLARQLAVLDERPRVAVVGSRQREVDAEGRELAPRTRFAAGVVNDVLRRYNPVPNTSAAFRRDVALAVGGYDERWRYAAEYDLWLRIVAAGHDVVALDEPLSTREMGGANVAGRAERAQHLEALLIQARALRRAPSAAGVAGLALPAGAWLAPPALKRALRRRAGQAP